MKNTTKSIYAEASERIYELTGYDCSQLDAEQMNIIGMAAERGSLVWDWGNAKFEEGDSEEAYECNSKIRRNTQELLDSNWASEAEVVGAYVGGMWEEL